MGWEGIKRDHQKYYKIYDKARNPERTGGVDEALQLYYEILRDYSSTGIVYYERPATILEKKRYSEVNIICERAIRKLDNKYFHADPMEFQLRIERVEKKLSKVK